MSRNLVNDIGMIAVQRHGIGFRMVRIKSFLGFDDCSAGRECALLFNRDRLCKRSQCKGTQQNCE